MYRPLIDHYLGGDVCSWGGVSAPGGSALGGICSQGSALGGCLLMGGVWSQEGCVSAPGGGLLWGIPCDLSHHGFDLTCMLPPHQLRPTNSAAAYIVLVM